MDSQCFAQFSTWLKFEHGLTNYYLELICQYIDVQINSTATLFTYLG